MPASMALVDTAEEGIELYCYNTEGDINSVAYIKIPVRQRRNVRECHGEPLCFSQLPQFE